MPGTTSYTYDTLIEQIQDEAEDASVDFTANLADILRRGESRVYADLNLEIFERVRTGSLTVSQFLQPIKPATWQATSSFHIRNAGGTGKRRLMVKRSYEYCLQYEPDETVTSEPKFFAEYSDTQFFVTPAPNAAYAFELREISQDAALTLSATNPNTWLATHAGDLLFASCMIEAERFLQSEGFDVGKWKEDYAEKLPVRRAVLRSLIRSGYAPVLNAPRTVEARE
jgi:hypothetical protein